MKNFANPPQSVQDELSEELKRCYPEFEKNENVFHSIIYNPGNPTQVKYIAEVNYHFNESSSTALFEYKKTGEKPSYHWHCRKDWRD